MYYQDDKNHENRRPKNFGILNFLIFLTIGQMNRFGFCDTKKY